MKTIKNLSIAVIGTAIFLLQSTHTQAGTITFSDSTFNNEDWELTPFIYGSAGVNTNQIASSDNQFRLIVNTLYPNPNGSFSYILGFNQRIGAVYNPQLQGAISSIDYSENSILFSQSIYGQLTGLALKQNQKIYMATVGATQEYSWTTKSANNLQQSDFYNFSFISNATENPDFSSTGTPIELGFFRANSTCLGCGGYTMVAGIDNWSVKINQDESQPVPEPATVLSGLAFSAFIAKMRMKRKRQQNPLESTGS
ncbi:MAG TPA: hypothetical protein VK211_26360 [Kamptonema sp.]|nr:hypothetical protein [Kamptonema sp.]